MKQVLHPKIQALKQRAAPINYRALSVDQTGTLVKDYAKQLDDGIVEGYGAQWTTPNSYRELFVKGAFAKSIQERGPGTNSNYEIKFFRQHSQADPLSLFDQLDEDLYGLHFKTKPLDERDIEMSSAASVLRKLKTRTLNNFSIGYDYVWDKMEYDDKADVIIIKEAALYEISVVGIPADMGTFQMRSAEQLEEMYDEAEEFISKLPRSLRMEARALFAQYKSLIKFEPQTENESTHTDKPVEERASRIDYNHLITNFKL